MTMEKRIKAYLAYVDAALAGIESMTDEERRNLKNEHLVQISFFQHERLIHLIVTVLFALMEIMALALVLTVGGIVPTALTILLLVLLVPYVRHYYILENSVQRMYVQYDIICGDGFGMK